jgi:uncharacterized membrane protein (DUF4010 family)
VEPYENHFALATALAVGLLIGLEREQATLEAQRTAPETERPLAGIRTYPIFALVGALAMMLAAASPWIPLAALLGVVVLVAISYSADVRRDRDHGVTSEISVVATFLLGALAATRGVVEPMGDRFLLVAGLGVALAFLLSSKPRFHGFVARVSRDDLYAAIKFLIVAVIVVPLLPDHAVGPLGAINPRHLGLMVVTISALSFAGYVAMKLWGARRGLLVGAALGGLVSSTAVTLSMAGRTKAEPKLAPMAAGALGRVAVLVGVVEPALLATLALPLGAMIAAALAGLALTFKRGGEHAAVDVQNPFELGSAVKVSLMFALVLLVTKAANAHLGSQGLYLASALSGTTDVDAVTLSSARLAVAASPTELAAITPIVAATSITIAIAVNTVVKTGMALAVGGTVLGRRVGVVGALVVVAGAGGLGVALLRA